ncbi:nicastrin isoform X2 [Cannabis sativa]|uniref:nicastrin isoform X2 n=1 Tax=Cannabis sativa TaxID=3483 RepID=UPI0029CA983D|nr:nicastrin isoform X2 [Cannabis sativa]
MDKRSSSTIMASSFLLFLFLFNFQLSLAETNLMQSVPDLQNSMYKVVDGDACVRLLNLSGEIGCSNPGREKVVAPIIRFRDANSLSRSSAVLLSLNEIQDFFIRVSTDSTFARNVGGVLVESKADFQNMSKGFSPAHTFPQAEFSPYKNTNYKWNPIGSGIMWNQYDFPVFLLSESSTKTIQEVSEEILKRQRSYTTVVAEFDLVMQTVKAGTHDSESCLKEETCFPLGGYSVWSSLPPLNISSSDQGKPIILAVASMDSASFFRDKSLGADSPISGLIALLAAVDALSHLEAIDGFDKQLVFLVFTGEAWGYLGSRRFLHELDLQSDAVKGLNTSLFEMIIEVGSVGKGFNEGVTSFHVHTTGVSSATNKTLDALNHAQDSLKSRNISISSAAASNPGIPPSSLMSFLNKNPITSGVVLEDFDTIFSNKFYHSHLDDSSNLNSSSIVAAASLLARTLYVLTSDTKDDSKSALASVNVNVSLVEQLMGCLLECEPGLSCELVKNFIAPSSTCPSHYVGVISEEPSSTPSPEYIGDVSRFVWNFLADKTSPPKGKTPVCSEDCSKKGGVCTRAEVDGKGICVFSTTRYVPAYSTRLSFESGTWNVLPPNSSDPMGMHDPVWTESNWNAIGLRVYTVQSAAYDRLVLLGGIAITGGAYLAIILTRAFVAKILKQD